MQETWIQSLGQEGALRSKWQPTKYSCLGNPMDRGAWQATAYGLAKESVTI